MNIELNLYKALVDYMATRGGLDDGPLAEAIIPAKTGDRIIVPVLLLKEHPDDVREGKIA